MSQAQSEKRDFGRPLTDQLAIVIDPLPWVLMSLHGMPVRTCPVFTHDASVPEDWFGPVLRVAELSASNIRSAIIASESWLGAARAEVVSCFGFDEETSYVAAEINDAFRWRGNRTWSLDVLADKAELRDRAEDLGVAPVARRMADDCAELAEAVAAIGVPCIVKPAGGRGSEGVHAVLSQDDAAAVCAELRASWPGPIVVEEFLAGPEYSIETLTNEGDHEVLAITERRTNGARRFVAAGHVLPVELDPEVTAEIHELAVRTLDAAGLRFGPAHTEVILTDEGPRLLESHGHSGAGHIAEMLLAALGVNVFTETVSRVLAVAPPQRHNWRQCAGITYVDFASDRPLAQIPLTSLRALPDVLEVEVRVRAGSTPPLVRSDADRHGFVVAVSSSRPELDETLLTATEAMLATAERQDLPVLPGADYITAVS